MCNIIADRECRYEQLKLKLRICKAERDYKILVTGISYAHDGILAENYIYIKVLTLQMLVKICIMIIK